METKNQESGRRILAGRRLGLVFSLVAALATSAAADVHIVDDDGGAAFSDIQSAVDAAAPGDIVLVRAGTYAGFVIDAKPLSVAGLGPLLNSVRIEGSTSVRNIAPDDQVLLSRLTLQGADGAVAPPLGHGLSLRASEGSLRLQSCIVLGGELGSPFDAEGAGPASLSGAAAILVDDCDDVVLMDVGCEGGLGQSVTTGPGGPGGPGLAVTRSTLAVLDCTLVGGVGGSSNPSGLELGGTGGVGVQLTRNTTLFALGGRFMGGFGGWGSEFGPLSSGGTGLEIAEDCTARVRDVALLGGFGGFNVGCNCNGPSGAAFVELGRLETVPGSPPAFAASPAVVATGQTLSLSGDTPALLLISLDAMLTYLPARQGPLVVAPAWIANGVPLNGTPLEVLLPAPLGVDGLVLHLQSLSLDGLGPAGSLVLLDAPP